MESIFGNDEHELIKHSDVHHFMGVSKKDAEMLLRDYPNVPHIKLMVKFTILNRDFASG